jgi:hypothetical protein
VVDGAEEPSLQPEVRVRSVRRRRKEPPLPLSPPPPNIRNWTIYAALAALVAALMVDGFLRHRPPSAALPTYSQATEVRSTIAEVADSLQVVVSWDLTLSGPAGRPDSIRIKVTADPRRDSLISVQSSSQVADTLYLAAPPRGGTLRGLSCAAAQHPGQPLEESCTPWQFVRPNVVAGQTLLRGALGRMDAGAVLLSRI